MFKVLKKHWVLFSFTGLWAFSLMSPMPVGITIWFGWMLFIFYIWTFTRAKFGDGKPVQHDFMDDFMDGKSMGPGPATTMSMYDDIGEGFGGAYED